jgi:myo-inositol-1(or 4)-monophosphatase
VETTLKPAPQSSLLKAVIDAVREVAHKEILPRYLKVAHRRKNDGSLFTEADLAAQEALCRRLTQLHPAPLVGEEMTAAQQSEQYLLGAEGLWCVDPIDGTSNFVKGLPYFAVSVALLERGRPVLGVVYDPVAEEAFYAEAGRGAFLNGEPLPIREPSPSLAGALASVDLKRLSPRLACELAASPPYMSQRNYGASTLEWCYTAAGRFDVYLHGGQKLWDYAAGCLILAEAGGAMGTLTHDDFWADDLWRRSVVAALDHQVFQEWKTWLRQKL